MDTQNEVRCRDLGLRQGWKYLGITGIGLALEADGEAGEWVPMQSEAFQVDGAGGGSCQC